MTIRIEPKYQYLQDYLLSLPSTFEAQGEYVYGGKRNLIKKFTAPDGLLINVKRYHKPQGLNLLVYSFGLRKPKGQRAYEYPSLLLARGIDTPEPVAYMEDRRGPWLRFSYFVSIQCPYAHNLYEMAEAEPQLREEMAVELARFAARMHEQGVLHLDFTPGNILWDRNEEGKISFSIVDINRMKFGAISFKEGLLSLRKLWGSRMFMMRLAEEYAVARGHETFKAKEMLMTARAKFWKHYLSRHEKPFDVEI